MSCYIISSVQLGMINAFVKLNKTKEINELIDNITSNQFISENQSLWRIYHLINPDTEKTAKIHNQSSTMRSQAN